MKEQYGLINACDAEISITVGDEIIKLVGYAEQFGLDQLTVGPDVDMQSELMQQLRASGRFTISAEFTRIPRQLKCIGVKKPASLTNAGPRDKWGKVK